MYAKGVCAMKPMDRYSIHTHQFTCRRLAVIATVLLILGPSSAFSWFKGGGSTPGPFDVCEGPNPGPMYCSCWTITGPIGPVFRWCASHSGIVGCTVRGDCTGGGSGGGPPAPPDFPRIGIYSNSDLWGN